MKRIILISLCLLLCLSAAHSQRLVIKGLSTQSIQIGNKTLTKGKEFNANEKIHWSVKGQSMRLMFQDGEKRGLFINVCREALERIGAENVAQYLCWCNQTWFERFKSNFGLTVNNKPSTRSSVELMEKTASNFPEKRLALIIGNSNYEYLDPLANPLNDVTKVAEKLQSLGFDVLPVYDADDREINSKLNWLKRQSKYDVVIVYYSGHGIQNGNKQYLIPVNGKLDDENDLDYCISLEDVYESLNALGKDKTKMVFVDACRNQGKWQSKIEADSRQEGEDIAVLYSTSTGSKASDGEAGENSPFAQAFLEEIGNPTDNVTTTIGKIKNAVKEKSNQIPIDINFTGQTFTFNPHGTEKTQQAGISLKTDADEMFKVEIGEIKPKEVGYNVRGNQYYFVYVSDKVSHIREEGFRDCTDIWSINIPSSVKNIGKNVFIGCENLNLINISPENPIYDSRDSCNAIIEKETNTLIAGCKETIIPKTVTKIGPSAFENCTNLYKISIPESVTSIEDYAFKGCTGLESISIPESVTSIGYSAFEGCTNLKTITISKSISRIDTCAFKDCEALESIVLPRSLKKIEPNTFERCKSLTSVTIPSFVTRIGSSAFNGCSGLTSVTIPNSVTSIGESAFEGCSALTSVTIGNSVTSIGDNAFERCISLTSVTIPNSVTSIGDNAFERCTSLTSVTIPNSVTSIGRLAFDGCINLEDIEIPESIIYIGWGAFKETLWFEKQPDGLVYIGKVAYKYKGEMPQETSIKIKEGTTCITDIAFKGCSGLKNISIPESVTTIGDAFMNCDGLTSIKIPNSVTIIENGAFSGCKNLVNITIPSSVTEIGDAAFFECANLQSITIPSSCTMIGEQAFLGCEKLKNISFPDSILSIGRIAFDYIPWFENQPDGLIYIGRVAYKYKGKMPKGTSIIIKDGTYSIAERAFKNCDGLTDITIPNSVTKIGLHSFSECSGLTEVVLPKSITIVEDGFFCGCTGLKDLLINRNSPPEFIPDWRYPEHSLIPECTLHVPKGCKEAYENEEPWCDFKEIVDDL